MNTFLKIAPISAAVLVLAACSSSPASVDYDQLTAQVTQSSFQANGQAGLERLKQDDANRLCSAADVAGVDLQNQKRGVFASDAAVQDGAGLAMGSIPAKEIEAANFKSIQWPADGKFLGDWKNGEKLAQSGRGLTWSDKPGSENGGNCYNCHQMTKEEISFGTIGPSLYHYGKLRGVTDPGSASAKVVVEYTWGKLWNARAYNACSQMPRVGHNGILDMAGIKDVMALLLDPASPVNK